MAKTVVLVRHGKAERRAEGQQDIDRALTPAGAQALEAHMPATFAQLEATGPLEVWTSAALRARQTSERVIGALAANGISVAAAQPHESLLYQDLGAFLDELAASDADCVVAVGHIPFMGEALERLTGDTIRFSPGAVACVRLEGDPHSEVAQSRTLWFTQGPEVA